MKLCLAIFFLFAAATTHADSVHQIDLQSRTASEVIPIVEPLLLKGESITGTGFLLFIQTSSQRATELRQLIASIDQRGKMLRISVTSDENLVAHENAIQASVRVDSGDTRVIVGQATGGPETNVVITGKYATRNTTNTKTQFINLEEGAPAFVAKETLRFIPVNTFISTARGIAEVQSTQVNTRTDGFYVEAHILDKEYASIKIQSSASSNQPNNTFENAQLSADTSLRARIGQWVELGGIGESNTSTSTGILNRTRRSEDRFNRIFMKVEVIN